MDAGLWITQLQQHLALAMRYSTYSQTQMQRASIALAVQRLLSIHLRPALLDVCYQHLLLRSKPIVRSENKETRNALARHKTNVQPNTAMQPTPSVGPILALGGLFRLSRSSMSSSFCRARLMANRWAAQSLPYPSTYRKPCYDRIRLLPSACGGEDIAR